MSEHDKLQQKCWLLAWNKYPETRYCLFHVPNELRPYKGESKLAHVIRIQQARGVGLLAGVLDFIFHWNNRMYILDIKVGKDSLSDAQKKFIETTERNGGKFLGEISDLDQFEQILVSIIRPKTAV